MNLEQLLVPTRVAKAGMTVREVFTSTLGSLDRLGAAAPKAPGPKVQVLPITNHESPIYTFGLWTLGFGLFEKLLFHLP